MDCLWCGRQKGLLEHFTKYGFCHRCDTLVREQIKDSLFTLSLAADDCDARLIRHRGGGGAEPGDAELLRRLDEAVELAASLEALREAVPFFKTSLDDARASLLRCRAILPGAPALPEPPPFQALPGETPEAAQKREEFRTLLAGLETAPIPLADRPKHPKRRTPVPLRSLTCAQMAAGTNVDKLGSYIALDVKTTGADPRRAQVVGVSAIRFEAFRPYSLFTTLFVPDRPISPREALRCGVDNELVRGMPLIDEAIPALRDFLGDTRLVGYNLAAELRLLSIYGIKPPAEARLRYDTQLLARSFLSAPDALFGKTEGAHGFDVSNYALPTLCDHFGIYYEDRYRPGADCLSIGLLFAALVRARASHHVGDKQGARSAGHPAQERLAERADEQSPQ